MDNPKPRPGTLVFVVLLSGVMAALANTSAGAGLTNTSMAVQVPIELKLFLGVLLLAGCAAGFNYILHTIGLDLTPYAQPLSLTLSTFLVSLAQHWIDLIPVQYDPAIQMLLNVLVVIVGGLGTLAVLSKRSSLL
jgi:hypothetical protein